MHSLAELEVSRAYPARALRIRHDTGPLVLRPTVATDAEAMAADVDASLAELRAFMPWAHQPQTARTQLDRLRVAEADYFAGREMIMGLYREADGAMLSGVGLHPRVPLNASALEIGYWAPTPHAGKGWTTFAVKVALVYAFDKLGADRVQVMCDEANAPSRRVVDKCGFALEGVLRNVISDAPPELAAKGYASTRREPIFALFPDTFAVLPWVADVRARLQYENLVGHVVR